VAGRNSDNTLIKKTLHWEPRHAARQGSGGHLPVDQGTVLRPQEGPARCRVNPSRGSENKTRAFNPQVIDSIPNRLRWPAMDCNATLTPATNALLEGLMRAAVNLRIFFYEDPPQFINVK